MNSQDLKGILTPLTAPAKTEPENWIVNRLCTSNLG